MPLWVWFAFVVLVTALILFDLVVLHRRSHAISLRESLGWTGLWVFLALVFNGVVYGLYAGLFGPELSPADGPRGDEAALQFLTGYLVEYSLSVDNIFVIAMIIANFHVPREHQHRLLFWGVLGAALLRGVMIVVGTTLVQQFEWVMYIFGGLLILSAAKMLVTRHDNINPDGNLLIRLTRRLFPVTPEYHGKRFFVRQQGQWLATPMLLALVLIESCDVMFAVDSIPAVFAITRDPFLIFTSNIFAILGLRSLYFALAGLMDRFRYLKMSLVFLLVFIGVKMLLMHHYPIPNVVSLAMIAGILAVGVGSSVFAGGQDTARLHSPLEPEIASACDQEDPSGIEK
ncbi:MAG: TerC family protein [Planctomycetaceae bacterium]